MRIKVLGCSGGVGPGLRTTSLMLDDHVLIDAGTGVGDLSLDEMSGIAQVYLTHAHLDHICGLAFIADNLFDVLQRPIEVIALPQTLGILRQHVFNWQVWPDFFSLPCADAPVLVTRELAVGAQRELPDGGSIQSFPVCHTVPANGYVLRSAAGGVFAFTGDTGACDEMWDWLNALPRLDQLMIDIAFPDEEAELGARARHLTPAVTGRELAKLRHRPRLLLTHHKPGCDDLLHNECAAALQGWQYHHLRRGDLIEV